MTPSIIQIAVVTLIAFIYGAEKNAGQILTNMSVTPAWFVGLALGDPVTGLAVGAIVQLMSLGVAAMGGASVPDYPTAAIIGAVVAITSGQEASVGVAAGIAVGMLGLQLDVIAKTANGFLGRTSQRFAEEGKYSQMKSVLFSVRSSMALRRPSPRLPYCSLAPMPSTLSSPSCPPGSRPASPSPPVSSPSSALRCFCPSCQ